MAVIWPLRLLFDFKCLHIHFQLHKLSNTWIKSLRYEVNEWSGKYTNRLRISIDLFRSIKDYYCWIIVKEWLQFWLLKIITFRIQYDFPTKFWDNAAYSGVCTINDLPSSVLGYFPPFKNILYPIPMFYLLWNGGNIN